MAKVLFLQNTISELQGVMYLSRALKDAGHGVDVLIAGRFGDIARRIDAASPDVICFSLMYGHQFWARPVSEQIKRRYPSVPIIWGGIFPTFNADYLLNTPFVDAYFRGEGDDVIVPLSEAALDGRGFETVPGAAWLQGGQVRMNALPCMADISERIPDRDLYFSAYRILRTNPTKLFVSSRGCVGNCSYCYNSRIKGLYQDSGTGSYVRQRSADAFLDEISYVKKTYGLKRIFFYDDILIFNRRWAHDFLPRFRNTVGVPYMCYARADFITEDMVLLLKETGCYMLSFGLESGNEDLRMQVLNKRVSNETIEQAAAVIRKHGLAFNTTNMMGFPHETFRMGLETIELNIKIKAVGSCNILNPFPGTQLYEYCRQQNLFEERYFEEGRNQIHYYPMIKNPDREFLGNLERLFQLAVFFPRTMYPLVKRIARFRPNVVFDLIFVVMQFFYVTFVTERYGFGYMLKYYSEKMKSVFFHAH